MAAEAEPPFDSVDSERGSIEFLGEPIAFGLKEALIAVTVVGTAMGLIRMFDLVGLAATFVGACIFTFWLYTHHRTPPNRRPSWLTAAKSRWLFDGIWGIAMPLVCLWGDPFVFAKVDIGFDNAEGPTRQSVNAAGYLAYPYLGYQLVMMSIWMLFGARMRPIAGFFAGTLAIGVVIATLIGVCILPWSILGTLILGLGLMGFTPFLTARAFGRRSYESAMLSGNGRLVFWLSAHLGAALALAIPLTVYAALPLGENGADFKVPELVRPLFEVFKD